MDVDSLKQQGNDLFNNKNYEGAANFYSQALSVATDSEMKKVLFTNRSAARLGLNQFGSALEDANEAIALDIKYVKAYYRKCTALEGLNKPGEVYCTWLDAHKNCESNETITKSLKKTKSTWMKLFRKVSYPITSTQDLISRILLFQDKRERLSTLAYFWNDSSQLERHSYFTLLLTIIGGEGELSEKNMELLTAEVMTPLPMDNYVDLPADRLPTWFEHFRGLPSEKKIATFQAIWLGLNGEEQTDIIKDLKVLFIDNFYASGVAEAIIEEEDVEVVDEEISSSTNNRGRALIKDS